MSIQLNISKKQFTPKFYPYLFDYSKRWNAYMGSAGSGKSHFIMQKLIIKGLNSQRKIAICRRYGTSISKSTWELQKDILKAWKIFDICKINKMERTIELPNGTIFYHFGLDDELKLLSIQGITDFFIEETFECSKEIIDQIDLRLRCNKPDLQIYLAWNPINAHHWLYDFCNGETKPDSFFYSHSTYKDNPFLPQAYIDSLESFKTRNPAKWEVYGLGKWSSDPDGLVFKNVEYVEELDVNALLKNNKLKVKVGCDMGFTDPTTIAVSLYDSENHIIYPIAEYYQRGATLDEVYNAVIKLGISKEKIWMDSADPRAIQFMKSKRINAVGSIKGKNSVEARISFLQNNKIIVCEKLTPNMVAEFQNFSWVKDKQTSKYTDKTTHEWSHLCCDALGYSYCDIYTQSGQAINKSIFKGL